MLVGQMFRRLVRIGNLRVVDANGCVHDYGDGSTPRVTLRLHDRALHWQLYLRPSSPRAKRSWTDG